MIAAHAFALIFALLPAASAEELILLGLPLDEILKQTQEGAEELEKKSAARRELIERTRGLAERNAYPEFREDGTIEMTVHGPISKQPDGTGLQLAVSVVGSQDDASIPELFLAHERTITYRSDGFRRVARVIVADRWGNPIEIRESIQAKYKKASRKPALLEQNEFSRELPSILEAFGADSLTELRTKTELEGRQLEGGWPRVLSFQSMTENHEDGTTDRLNAVVRLLGPGPNAQMEVITVMENRRTTDFAVISAARKTRVIDGSGTVLSNESSLDVNRSHEDSAQTPSAPKPEDAQRLRDIFSQVLPRPA